MEWKESIEIVLLVTFILALAAAIIGIISNVRIDRRTHKLNRVEAWVRAYSKSISGDRPAPPPPPPYHFDTRG